MAVQRDIDGAQFIPLGGLNQSIIPESIPTEDMFYLQGLTQDRIGQLRRFPGKEFILRSGSSPILGIYPFGDFVLVATQQNLTRYTNAEFFGGDETQNQLTPDEYANEGGTDESAWAYAFLAYKLAFGNDGATLTAATWNTIPLNTEVVDPAAYVTLNGDGSFNLLDGDYIIRATNIISAGPNLRYEFSGRLLKNSSIIVSGVSQCANVIGAGSTNGLNDFNMKSFYRLTVESTDALALQVFTPGSATKFGIHNTANTSLDEVYALVEILQKP